MAPVNWTRQFALAITLFVFGTLAYWLEYKHKPEQEASEEQNKHIFQVKDQAVQSITLIDSSKKLVLSCQDLSSRLCKPGDTSKWDVVEPSKLKADDSNANALLSSLNTLSSTEIIDLKEETPQKREALLKEYGLDAQTRQNPKTVREVQIQTEHGKTTLYLGNTHPIGESIFAIEGKPDSKSVEQVNENRVYLIPTYFKSNFDHDLTYWRDKKLVTLGAHDIANFTLKGFQGEFTGEHKDGQWLLHTGSSQEPLTGDIESIDQMLSTISYLNAKNFAADQKDSPQAKKILTGLREILRVSIQKEKGSDKETPAPIVLQFFRKGQAKKATAQGSASPRSAEKTYAVASNLDPVFEVDGTTIDHLDKNIKSFRPSKLITSGERFSAKKMEFSGSSLGPSSLTLNQVDGKWTDSEKNPLAQEKVKNLLERLSGNRIQDFVENKTDPAQEKGVLKLTLADGQSAAKREYYFWKKGDKLYAKDLKSQRNEAFLLDSTLQTALPWERNFFSAAEPKPTPSLQPQPAKKQDAP